VAGDIRGDAAAVRLEAEAVPVGVALVGALRASAAESAAHAAAQDVEASVAPAAALRVVERAVLPASFVPPGTLLDHLEQFLGDEGLVDGCGAPHPLLTRPLEGPAPALSWRPQTL
jgi:hypothetical protein